MSNHATYNRKGPEAALLFTIGLLAAASGLALAVLPDLLPDSARVVTAITGLGLQTGVLVMSGLVLVAMGALARAIPDAQPPAHEYPPAPDPTPALEALRREMAELRAIASRPVEVAASEPVHIEGVGPGQLDALFRIAASLDQFTAKIELGLKAEITNMRVEVRELRQALGAVEAILTRVTTRPSPAAPPAGARPMAPAPRPAAPDVAGHAPARAAMPPSAPAGAPLPRPRAAATDAGLAQRRPFDQGVSSAPSSPGAPGSPSRPSAPSGGAGGSFSLDLKNDSNGR